MSNSHGLEADELPRARKSAEDVLLQCPCFMEYYVGICTGFEGPYIPSAGERELFCFKRDFDRCPVYRGFSVRNAPDQDALTEGTITCQASPWKRR